MLRRSVRLFSSAKGKPSSKDSKRKSSKRDDYRIAPLPEPDLTPNAPATPANDGGAACAASAASCAGAMTPFGIEASVTPASVDAAMQLLNTLGKAVVAISHYNCTTAVEILSSLPQHQFYTGA